MSRGADSSPQDVASDPVEPTDDLDSGVSLPELTEQVDLCLPNGRINPAAIGYSRRPLHRTNLSGWGRNKRWEYWGAVTPELVVGMTISDLDYLKVHQLYVLDRAHDQEVVKDVLAPPWSSVMLPSGPGPIHATATTPQLSLSFADIPGGTKLTAHSARVDVELLAAGGQDSLAVVVPWGTTRFQYTVKDVARPLSGTVTIDGRTITVTPGESFAVLDRGRGRWPYSKKWNWGAGSGLSGGKRLGLQVGGKWTDGTGSTENALVVDGRLSYWPDELRWRYDLSDTSSPWQVQGEQVEATLTPFRVRAADTNAALVASSVRQAFGTWSGRAVDSDGVEHSLDGLLGWAEEASNRW